MTPDKKPWLILLALAMIVFIFAVHSKDKVTEKLKRDLDWEKSRRESDREHYEASALLQANRIEVEGDLIRVTFNMMPTTILRMKNRHLTWDDVRRLAPQINSGKITIEDMHADVRGVTVLLVSLREQSEVLP